MTPIEKSISHIEAVLETAKQLGINGQYQQGATNALTNIQEYLKSLLPTEAEHTKQVGTGFAEWLGNRGYKLIYDGQWGWIKGNDNTKHTTSELWEEYILTLQNKKG
jgi:hypothetical protein